MFFGKSLLSTSPTDLYLVTCCHFKFNFYCTGLFEIKKNNCNSVLILISVIYSSDRYYEFQTSF